MATPLWRAAGMFIIGCSTAQPALAQRTEQPPQTDTVARTQLARQAPLPAVFAASAAGVIGGWYIAEGLHDLGGCCTGNDLDMGQRLLFGAALSVATAGTVSLILSDESPRSTFAAAAVGVLPAAAAAYACAFATDGTGVVAGVAYALAHAVVIRVLIPHMREQPRQIKLRRDDRQERRVEVREYV